MICSCGETTNNTPITRGEQSYFYRYCPKCGRELADGKAADLLNERFKWNRVGWYQDTLTPLTFLTTEARMYGLCLLRRPDDYVDSIESAQKYLHGLTRIDGSMIFNEEGICVPGAELSEQEISSGGKQDSATNYIISEAVF